MSSSTNNVPSLDKLSPNEAKKLNDNLGTILCMEIKEQIKFGIDYVTFEIGSKFKGVKMIPVGAHYIHTSPDSTSERMGFFIYIEPKSILVFEWNEQTKCLISFKDKSQLERLKIGVKRYDFDKNLGPYPFHNYQIWKSLSSFITKELIQQLESISGLIASTYTQIINSQNKNTNTKEEEESKTQYEYEKNKDCEEKYEAAKKIYSSYNPKYTKIIQLSGLKGVKKYKHLQGSALTKLYMDRTDLFYLIINENEYYKKDINNFLGELQYAFICLLIGESVKGLNQWKNIIDLICNCEKLIMDNQKFYWNFVNVLIYQLKQLPDDFFKNELTCENFLNDSLKQFMNIFDEIKGDMVIDEKFDLKKVVKELNELLDEKFDKVIQVGEDKPIVVSVPKSTPK